MKPNKLIDALEEYPCTMRELPYHVYASMELANQKRILKIKVAGTRTNTRVNRYGRFTTVYYLEGDEDRAVQKFVEVNVVEVNAGALVKVDFGRNNMLRSGLPKHILKKIREAMRL